MFSDTELQELAEDIHKNGLIEAIVLHEGMILDGRNRYAACELTDIEPQFVEWNGHGGSPTLYVLSKNLHRRHLTSSQKAAIAAESLPLLKVEARKRMLAGKSFATNPRSTSSQGYYYCGG
jgi:ParB-like chromosome segregation protein Spo0J